MTAFAFTWNATFEGQPDDTEGISNGALRIRNLKVAIHERLAVDHSWLGDANDGVHLQVTMPEASGDPASAANTGFVYTKDVSGTTELFYEDSTGAVSQLTTGGTINSFKESTGVGKEFWGSTLPTGYVWANGQTIGDASSSATGRANADCQALFTLLWNSTAQAQLPISGGRGANAAADWAAHKAIALPDKRSRVSVGGSTMGSTSDPGTITSGVAGFDPTVLAITGGDQHPQQHNHTLTDPGHSHSITMFSGANSVNGQPATGNSSGQGASSTQSHTTGITLADYGTGAAGNVQPTIVCNYIIKL